MEIFKVQIPQLFWLNVLSNFSPLQQSHSSLKSLTVWERLEVYDVKQEEADKVISPLVAVVELSVMILKQTKVLNMLKIWAPTTTRRAPSASEDHDIWLEEGEIVLTPDSDMTELRRRSRQTNI